MTDLPTGFPTDDDLDEAERLCRSYAPAAEVGAYGNLIRAIARTLADERRKAFNEGAVEGMKLTRTLTEERRLAFNESAGVKLADG